MPHCLWASLSLKGAVVPEQAAYTAGNLLPRLTAGHGPSATPGPAYIVIILLQSDVNCKLFTAK